MLTLPPGAPLFYAAVEIAVTPSIAGSGPFVGSRPPPPHRWRRKLVARFGGI